MSPLPETSHPKIGAPHLELPHRREFLQRALSCALSTGAYAVLHSAFGSALAVTSAWADEPGKISRLALQALSDSLENEAYLLLPTDSRYSNHRFSYNRRFESVAPALIALCLTDQAVSQCVQWAVAHGIELRVRSGGHCYEDFSIGPQLLIDLSLMDSIVADVPNQTAKIQPGARLGTVYQTLYPMGLVLPAGSCPRVGAGGLTLGGGYGMLSRKWGLTCDHLLQVQIVTADGRIVVANDSQNSDLFWACRGGGGGNFGIVTEFTFRVRPADPVTVYSISWEPSQAAKVIAAWQDWAPAVDSALTSHLTVNASAQGAISISSGGQLVGSQRELDALLEPLLKRVKPKRASWKSLTLIQAVEHFTGGPDATPTYFKATSDYARTPLSEKSIEVLLQTLRSTPGGGGSLMFDAYGGAINRVPAGETAFCHRAGTLYSVQYYAQWEKPEESDRKIAWVRQVRSAMKDHFSGYAYVNYCDVDLGPVYGQDYRQAYYGANYSRLSQIKLKYDPAPSVFTHAQGIEPAITHSP